jgi:hypothetical protein
VLRAISTPFKFSLKLCLLVLFKQLARCSA